MPLLRNWQKRRKERYSVYRGLSIVRLIFLLAAILFLMWYLGKFIEP